MEKTIEAALRVDEELQIFTPLEEKSNELLSETLATTEVMKESFGKLVETEDEDTDEIDRNIQWQLGSLKRATFNLLRAVQEITDVSEELGARWGDIKHSRRKSLIPPAPANAEIDLEEKKRNHFIQGLNFYKLFILCVLGSFIGVVIEMIWCFITTGHIESRAGLVYGPFNLLYGVGAVGLTLALYAFRNRGWWISFIGGFVVGSVLEYLCSWIQELLLGSTSWDYFDMPFNINGRICLLYSIFWGILGVIWIKNIYPRLASLMLKIPNKPGVIIVWVVFGLLVINGVVTCTSLYRWKARLDGIPPSNAVFEYVDERFTNERMERIFANMEFGSDENTQQ